MVVWVLVACCFVCVDAVGCFWNCFCIRVDACFGVGWIESFVSVIIGFVGCS